MNRLAAPLLLIPLPIWLQLKSRTYTNLFNKSVDHAGLNYFYYIHSILLFSFLPQLKLSPGLGKPDKALHLPSGDGFAVSHLGLDP